jgi:hypothetical protein
MNNERKKVSKLVLLRGLWVITSIFADDKYLVFKKNNFSSKKMLILRKSREVGPSLVNQAKISVLFKKKWALFPDFRYN